MPWASPEPFCHLSTPPAMSRPSVSTLPGPLSSRCPPCSSLASGCLLSHPAASQRLASGSWRPYPLVHLSFCLLPYFPFSAGLSASPIGCLLTRLVSLVFSPSARLFLSPIQSSLPLFRALLSLPSLLLFAILARLPQILLYSLIQLSLTSIHYKYYLHYELYPTCTPHPAPRPLPTRNNTIDNRTYIKTYTTKIQLSQYPQVGAFNVFLCLPNVHQPM